MHGIGLMLSGPDKRRQTGSLLHLDMMGQIGPVIFLQMLNPLPVLQGQILIKTPAHQHIQSLMSLADTKHGDLVFQRIPSCLQPGVVNLRPERPDHRKGLLIIIPGSHILSSRKQKPVAKREGRLRILCHRRCRNQHRHAAVYLNRTDIGTSRKHMLPADIQSRVRPSGKTQDTDHRFSPICHIMIPFQTFMQLFTLYQPPCKSRLLQASAISLPCRKDSFLKTCFPPAHPASGYA